jgi:transcriptional regulator with XRE-family HTH domain
MTLTGNLQHNPIDNRTLTCHCHVMFKRLLPGTWFRDARIKAGLQLSEVASALSVHPNTVQNWERGRSFPDLSMTDRIAALFHVSFSRVAVETAKLAIALRDARQRKAG